MTFNDGCFWSLLLGGLIGSMLGQFVVRWIDGRKK